LSSGPERASGRARLDVRTAGAGAVLVLATGCYSSTSLVEINTSSLLSNARDGAMLARQVVIGNAGFFFARAHAQELQDDVVQIRNNVTDEKLPRWRRIEKLANRVAIDLGDLATTPQDATVARRVRSSLLELSHRIGRITP
jgi:hypothetical protein